MAKQNRRSLTAEIVARLERSLADVDDLGISDRDRMNPESCWYMGGSAPAQEGQRRFPVISKEKLLASSDDDRPVTKRELNDMLMDAMMEALDVLRDKPRGTAVPTKGPASRKRYPKE